MGRKLQDRKIVAGNNLSSYEPGLRSPDDSCGEVGERQRAVEHVGGVIEGRVLRRGEADELCVPRLLDVDMMELLGTACLQRPEHHRPHDRLDRRVCSDRGADDQDYAQTVESLLSDHPEAVTDVQRGIPAIATSKLSDVHGSPCVACWQIPAANASNRVRLRFRSPERCPFPTRTDRSQKITAYFS
jgi:hypothetical protein